jgi:hypothetical protein
MCCAPTKTIVAEVFKPPWGKDNNGKGVTGKPKVAKFLVGQVPTCTNGVTTWALSQRGARRNCSSGEDAAFPHRDGKTLEPLL